MHGGVIVAREKFSIKSGMKGGVAQCGTNVSLFMFGDPQSKSKEVVKIKSKMLELNIE